MKTIISIFCALALLALTGCKSLPPGVAFKTWTHDGNYGPVTTHYEATNASKDPATGKIVVEHYAGHMKVLGGYGVSDTIEGLVIEPAPTIAPPKP